MPAAHILRRSARPVAPLRSIRGGEGTRSVLSTIVAAHSIGDGFLGLLTMVESNALRCVCREFREAVMDFPWMDVKALKKGSLKEARLFQQHVRSMLSGAAISTILISFIFEAMRVHG